MLFVGEFKKEEDIPPRRTKGDIRKWLLNAKQEETSIPAIINDT